MKILNFDGNPKSQLFRKITSIRAIIGVLIESLDRGVPPKGGPVTFPKFANDVSTDDFCLKLVEDHSVLIPPGKYAFNTEGFIRIGYGESRQFEEAMSRVSDALEQFLS